MRNTRLWLRPRPESEIEGVTADRVIDSTLSEVEVPRQ